MKRLSLAILSPVSRGASIALKELKDLALSFLCARILFPSRVVSPTYTTVPFLMRK